jgi:CRP-like cAMP-binding protein
MDQSRRFVVPGQNRLLSALSRDVQIRLLPRMEKLSLTLRQILYEPDAPITHVYFPLSGVVSLVILLRGGDSVEVGTVGNEGMAGTPAFLGVERSPARVLSQVAGQALRMRVANLR